MAPGRQVTSKGLQMGAQWEAGNLPSDLAAPCPGPRLLLLLFYALSGLAISKVQSHPKTALTSSINAELRGGVPSITLGSDNFARSCEL